LKRLLVALALLLVSAAPAAALDPFKAAGIDRKTDARVPMDITFKDELGASVTLRTLSSGKPMLLVPVQHQCPNLCGVTLAGLLQAISGQGLRAGADFTVVAFGIDPKEGPPAAADSLNRLLADFPAFPRAAIHGLTGTEVDIAAVTQALGYRYAWDPQLAQYDHVAAIAVVTADGRLARWLYGVAPAAKDVTLALTEAGQGQVGGWTEQLLLLCYHYDPVNGRYSGIIWTMLRLLAGATIAGIAFYAWRAVMRDRRLARGRPS
jgi:protein SCO1/2